MKVKQEQTFLLLGEVKKTCRGTLDSILANGNGIGQFYIRVNDTDYAFKTGCELNLLTSLPLPSAQMPTHIDSGMYLVGNRYTTWYIPRSIGADSCYWARLKDVDGELDSIITNDNATGQFYIQSRVQAILLKL